MEIEQRSLLPKYNPEYRPVPKYVYTDRLIDLPGPPTHTLLPPISKKSMIYPDIVVENTLKPSVITDDIIKPIYEVSIKDEDIENLKKLTTVRTILKDADNVNEEKTIIRRDLYSITKTKDIKCLNNKRYKVFYLAFLILNNKTLYAKSLIKISKKSYLYYKNLTPLMAASIKGNLEIVELLLKKKVRINKQDKKGFTALHYASMTGNSQIVKYLLENGADITIPNSKGETSLHLACKYGDLKTIKILIDKGGYIDPKKYINITPIHYASSQAVKDFLMERGCGDYKKRECNIL